MTHEKTGDKIYKRSATDRRLATFSYLEITACALIGGYFSFFVYVRISTIKVAMPTIIESSS